MRSSHNLLEEIPDLSALTELTELRLSHNKIKKIPYSLAKLSASLVYGALRDLTMTWLF